MKILHFSDTHLGFNDLDIVNEKGINQREADFYNAFTQVIDQIERQKPDFIIHTGDLFHRASPSNRAITFTLEQFKRVEKLKIPFIIIAGNHSTPRTEQSAPILKILDTFENFYAAYNQTYEKVVFDNIIFHTIPHINDETKVETELERFEKNIEEDKKNILLMHCSVGAHYLMQEFGEWVYPKEKEYLFEKMDYVALGHWHGFGSVGKHKNVYYSGSTERTSSSDKRNSKGYAVINLNGSLDVNYKEIAIRKYLEFEIDCEAFESSLETLDASDIKDALIDVKLTNLTAIQSIDIQNSDIEDKFQEALYVNVKREFISRDDKSKLDDIEAISLEEYFLDHIKEEISDEEYERLQTKVKALFAHYEESIDDTH